MEEQALILENFIKIKIICQHISYQLCDKFLWNHIFRLKSEIAKNIILQLDIICDFCNGIQREFFNHSSYYSFCSDKDVIKG